LGTWIRKGSGTFADEASVAAINSFARASLIRPSARHVHVRGRTPVVEPIGKIPVPTRFGDEEVRPREAEAHGAERADRGNLRGIDQLHGKRVGRAHDLDEERGLGDRRLLRLAGDEHRPDFGALGKGKPQELLARVPHEKARCRDRESVASEERLVLGAVDDRFLYGCSLVPGDSEGKPGRRLGADVAEGVKDGVRGPENELAGKLSQVEGSKLLDDDR
jgi:hypothetical protein